MTKSEFRKLIREEIRKVINESNKMSMSYKLSKDDEHNIDHMWTSLSKDKTKSKGDIIDEISNKLGINWFEVSSWIKINIV